MESIQKDLDKLEQLAKIEEELGIDFITIYKAITKGIYINEYPECKKCDIKIIYDANKEWWLECIGYPLTQPLFLKIKDYGKTWVLPENKEVIL